MTPRKLLRINAVAVALSLLVSIPGLPAWSAVAGTARPGSVGGAMLGTAGTVRTASTVPSLSPSALTAAPLTSVSGLSAPHLSPAPLTGPAAAVLSAPAAAPAAAAPTAAAPAAAIAASAQIRELDPGAFMDVEEYASGSARWTARAVALFDGMLERPRPLLTSAGSGGSNAGPELAPADARFPGPHIHVALLLVDPGSPEGLNVFLDRLAERHGFRRDASQAPVRASGAVMIAGAVPVERLAELAKEPGVSAVEPIIVRRMAPYQAPKTETLFRSGVRRAAERNPLMGLLMTMPLRAFAIPAMIVPIYMGLSLAEPALALQLKPILLIGGFGLAATYSFLSPFFRFIPQSMRSALTYGVVAIGGSILVLNGHWFFGAWLALNAMLGMLAANKTFRVQASSPNEHSLDKLVNSAETALHVNLVGFQLLLLPLSLAMGDPFTLFGLVGATVMTVFAFGDRAPDPSEEPSYDHGPAPTGGLKDRMLASMRPKQAARPRGPREPFVTASKKTADLEKLAKADPDAALDAAARYLVNETDKRHEVRISALRVLSPMPIEKTLPVYLALLTGAAAPGVQLSKQSSHDKWWYYQWEALRHLGTQSAALSPASESLGAALRSSYLDRNASVRLMAGDVLRKFGLDPGPEEEQLRAASVAKPSAAPEAAPAPPSVKRMDPARRPRAKLWHWLVGAATAVVFSIWLMGGPATTAQPHQDIVAEQTETTSAPVVTRAPTTPLTIDELKLHELERIADAAERAAKAAELRNRMEAEAANKSSGWMFTLFLAFGPIALLVWLMIKMAKGGGMGGGDNPMSKGKAKANVEKPRTRFADVAGIDESMIEVEEIVDYLRNPGHYVRLGARVPKGVLLEGPPGSGKTLLARALAGETDANFISMSGSDFVEMFVGLGAARVRDLFKQARASRPAIIFIDEIDAVGKARGSGGPIGGNDEREQTINAMLAAMDGFTDSTGIIVVAATNRADTLDPALMRPGRFDRKIHVGAPELLGREAILAIHARKVRLGPDADLRYVARRTAGMTGAFLENVIFEAAGLAARRGADHVSKTDLDEGVDRATIGAKRSLKLSDALKLRIARHESGHVLANLLNERPELRQPTNKVTIVPHGTGALGFAEMGSAEGDAYLHTKSQLEARLDHALGGLVAERMYYGEWSTGPGSDLQYATRIARTMVQQLGMDEGLGLAQTGPDPNDAFGRQPFGDAIGGQVHEATKKLIAASYARVLKRLTENRDRMDAMSAALMEKETLIDTEIDQYAFGALPKQPEGETPQN